jgi:hypothetical protein
MVVPMEVAVKEVLAGLMHLILVPLVILLQVEHMAVEVVAQN